MPRPSNRIVLIGVTGVLVATAVAVLAGRHPSPVPTSAVLPAGSHTSAPASGPPLGARLTSSGVQADWVVTENQLPGTTNWRINGRPATGFIEGFADRTYATVGQPVRLFVSTSAPTFRMEAYRIGYYGGTGARLVGASPTLLGRVQPRCPLTKGVNMVSCANWTPSMTVQITQYFVQGDYLLKLIGADDEQTYVPLTVWDPTSHAAYLVKNDVYTWQAWNTYGGYDYYQGIGRCPQGTYPVCTRSRVVSEDRPYGQGDGSGEFLALEAPLVRDLEQRGLDVTYVDDQTVQDHPEILATHRALLSLGHDECWSLGERTAVTAATRAGLNIAFFGASAVLRHVRTQSSPIGPDRELVDYRDAAEDPLNGKGDPRNVTGNTWGSAPANWPSSVLVGEAYNGFLDAGRHASMKVVDQAAWIFQNTGLSNGSALPGVIASDVDSLESTPVSARPGAVQVFAHSALSTKQGLSNSRGGDTFYSDMTYYTDPASKAGVWDSGTDNWIPSLADGPATEPVRAMTDNVLWLFGQGPAGRLRPSVANWTSFYRG
jgi:hypothetical protein